MQMNRFDSLTSQDSSYQLQLFFGCRNLADLDFITVTDSFLVVKLQQPNKPQKLILQTKVYDNNLNPDYAETLTIQYFFEIRQKLKLQVWHKDQPPKLVGAFETSLGQIFGSTTNGLKKPLLNEKKKKGGQIMIRCEKVQKGNNHLIQFNLLAFNLPATSGFCCFGSSSDAFFRIYRKREKDELLIYESEVKYDNLNPTFRRIKLSERRLCRNDPDQLFQIRFYSHSSTGSHTYIGSVKTNINNIVDTKNQKITDAKGIVKGNIVMNNTNRYIKHTFMDYVYAGLQMNLITCIDFTASNGTPNKPNSLHFFQPGVKRSQYQQALQQVSKILLDYDSDKLVPLYGFGAKCNYPNFNSMGRVSHCFPLNGNENDANVFHLQGIVSAYRSALQFLQLSGPTHFSKLLGNAIAQAKTIKKQTNQYMIVFILTDGQIHDKATVIDQIVQCCSLPVSIIIVGIGNGQFAIMDQLDDDDCNLRDSKGRKTTRDLVQFVQFRKYKNNGVQLAKQVLQELPRQVQQYYQMMNIGPMNFPKIPPPMNMY